MDAHRRAVAVERPVEGQRRSKRMRYRGVSERFESEGGRRKVAFVFSVAARTRKAAPA